MACRIYDCTDKLLQLPKEQAALAQECNDKLVDDLLEGSLRLLDICSKAKDCLMQSKESTHELQSIIRRRRGDETGFAIVSSKYLISRKMTKKAIRKALKNLKSTKNELIASSANQENNTLSDLVTLSSLESLFVFMSDPKGCLKQSRWLIISKLVQPKRVVCNSLESETNEFKTVDIALQSLIAHKPSSIENFQSPIESLELCIKDIEIGVEQLSKKLIRNRVSLLNIFGHKS